ncbi:MAG: hypothetical protein LBR87_00890, partial [Synergistaceae bacterium]|nr:hypothetical protein [Synergistaceae bacterium]
MDGYAGSAVAGIIEKWKDNKEVSKLAKQMEVLGKNMAHLRNASDSDGRRKARIVWQKAASQFWDLLWAVVEAKIDAGPPDELEFDECERLFIDYGHLCSQYTTPNPAFEEQLKEPCAVDMYQYNRLTDYIKENYALIFGKPYSGPLGGVSLEEKLKRFGNELSIAKTRRRIAINTLVASSAFMEKPEMDEMLKNLDEGLQDATESDMRTKRVREADNAARAVIKERCKRYETAERTFWYLIDNLERALTKTDEPRAAEAPETSAQAPSAPALSAEDAFDPFEEIYEEANMKPAEKLPDPVPAPENIPEEPIDELDSEATAESVRDDAAPEGGAPDHTLKIIQNVLSLHDRTKFLAGLTVHVTNEAERWKTRTGMAVKKYKGQGIPALKMELREGINHKKDFMMLAARTARLDTSPLCQNKNKPISMARAGEIMMDITPLDPDMLRASRIRMYGIPRVILVPGQGLGVYDWED